MNVQILIRVIVVHVTLHINGYAADGINDFFKGTKIYHSVVVHFKAHQIGHFFFQIINIAFAFFSTDGISGVDFFHRAFHVWHSIARNAHYIGPVVHTIQRHYHNGVGVQAHFVGTNH